MFSTLWFYISHELVSFALVYYHVVNVYSKYFIIQIQSSYILIQLSSGFLNNDETDEIQVLYKVPLL